MSDFMNLSNYLRLIARKLGLGKALLKIDQLISMGIIRSFKVDLAKKKYLKKIINADPIEAGYGDIEVHMLLHSKVVYEGIWSLYSFAYHCQIPCRIVVHDDGTLSDTDIGLLSRIFPNCTIIDRRTADLIVLKYLRDNGYELCIRLRESLIFSLRLFDFVMFANNNQILQFDSDVLFFSCPEILINDLNENGVNNRAPNLYSLDNGNRYCVITESLTRLLDGNYFIERLNPGVLRFNKGDLDFSRIEKYLQDSGFWDENGTADYFAELTILSLEFSRAGAQALSNSYAICPSKLSEGLVSGHYCGGGYWASLYYTLGLPHLAKFFLKE